VESNGREILSLKSLDESNPQTCSPLEQLDSVLKSIPTDQAYSLKRELLVGVVPQSGETLTASGAASMCDSLLPLSALSSHSSLTLSSTTHLPYFNVILIIAHPFFSLPLFLHFLSLYSSSSLTILLSLLFSLISLSHAPLHLYYILFCF
jgi:hypothetical protein